MNEEPTDDQLIDAALTALDAAPPTAEEVQIEGPLSATLQAVEENRRPPQKTVCEDCPSAMWFASPDEVKCYCRIMFLVTWSTSEPNQITSCDGQLEQPD